MKNQKLQLKGAKKLTREDQKSILGGSVRTYCCLHDPCGNCVYWTHSPACPKLLMPEC